MASRYGASDWARPPALHLVVRVVYQRTTRYVNTRTVNISLRVHEVSLD